MPDHLVAPHGGALINLLIDPETAAGLRAASRGWPSWEIFLHLTRQGYVGPDEGGG